MPAKHSHAFDLRWIHKAEMALLLRAAGFSRFEVAGGFDGRPLVNDTDPMAWTAWTERGRRSLERRSTSPSLGWAACSVSSKSRQESAFRIAGPLGASLGRFPVDAAAEAV